MPEAIRTPLATWAHDHPLITWVHLTSSSVSPQFARAAPASPQFEIGLFLVPKDEAGVTTMEDLQALWERLNFPDGWKTKYPLEAIPAGYSWPIVNYFENVGDVTVTRTVQYTKETKVRFNIKPSAPSVEIHPIICRTWARLYLNRACAIRAQDPKHGEGVILTKDLLVAPAE